MGSESSDDKASSLWTVLPSFDPSEDNVREYVAKVRLLHGICPKRDRPMLAPRLAMLCRGTAWHQVRGVKPELLMDPENGVSHLLQALATWEESSELKTFELFERALYKTVQKADESTASFVNRLMVSFDDVGGDTTLKSVKAFVLLKQSNLNSEDKKKILTMTNGVMDVELVSNAMRSLSTRVLSGQEEKKKVYPTNHVEIEEEEAAMDQPQSVLAAMQEEEDLPQEMMDALISAGDPDAVSVQSFEKDLEDLFQEIPDLHQALVSYTEARQRIVERKRSRGFWPTLSKGKGGKNSFSSSWSSKSSRKGGSKGKEELMLRIARSNCRQCGERGHWKAECPNKPKEQANVVTWAEDDENQVNDNNPQVIFEAFAEDLQVRQSQHESMSNMYFVEDAYFVSSPLCNVNKFTQAQSEVKRFFAQWLNKVNLPFRKSRSRERSSLAAQAPKRPPGLPAEASLISKATNDAFKTKGMAIVDTGASRSVIGSENLPVLLAKLPDNIRARVREKPSRIGFRFGNNQIEHSFKQIHIPLENDKLRIWLIVEVVPKATPFLLSIQAMKNLGAVLDLSSGTCFLKTLQRSVPLTESKTGLLMIRMQDLCSFKNRETIFLEEVERKDVAAFVTSSKSDSQQSSDINQFDHADSSRDHDLDPRDCRSSDAITEDPAHDSDESGVNPDLSGRSSNGAGQPPATADAGSSQPKDQDRGDGQFPSSSSITDTVRNSTRSVSGSGDGRRFRGMGHGSECRSSTKSFDEVCPKPKDQQEPRLIPKSWNQEDGQGQASNRESWKTIKLSQPIKGSSQAWKLWHPLGSNGPTTSSNGTWQRLGLDRGSTEKLGPTPHLMGQEAYGQDLCRGLRFRSRVRQLDSGSSQQFGRSSLRFRHVLSDTPRVVRSSSDLEKLETWSEEAFVHRLLHVTDPLEARWLMAVKNHIRYPMKTELIDLLEVYAQADSRLVEEVRKAGGKTERFTKLHGDLSTFEGQVKLLVMILRLKPKHIWMAPEYFPWCAWNQFNAFRSMSCYQKISKSQEQSKIHLKLCRFIAKLQINEKRHFTLENPGTSKLWEQKEMQFVCEKTYSIFLDQCQFGLVHPEDHRPMKKYTRLQTTSLQMVSLLDGCRCKHEHSHVQIAGSCNFQGHRIPLSRFAAFYPRLFAKSIAKAVLEEQSPSAIPLLAADDFEAEEPEAKRPRIEPPRAETEDANRRKRSTASEKEPIELNSKNWEEIFQWCQQTLPKSGALEWTDESSWLIRSLRCLITDIRIQQVKACKGVEKYLVGNPDLPMRQIFCLCRKTKKIFDLGEENWIRLTLGQQRRKAMPSHIMLTVFGHAVQAETGHYPVRVPVREERVTGAELSKAHPIPNSGDQSVSMPSWTPAPIVNSGPKFLSLSNEQQSQLKRLHNNLGHPTSERLAKHLHESGALPEIVQGAKDFQCPACSERYPPKLSTPGQLKEPREFNEALSIDGFEWKGKTGKSFYVLHIFDEATHFHLGKLVSRGAIQAEKALQDLWFIWAGPPEEIHHDLAGEFVSQEWKDWLQKEGIQAVTSAAPWQRGRVERHGGIIKEMLSRMDNEHEILTEQEFETALHYCFQAKNSMITINGFSPEQAVFGRARRLPTSLTSDENLTSHAIELEGGTRSQTLQKHSEMRMAARMAFLHADNSQALRRALLRQSRGSEMDWKCGHLCMVWDKRKSPNMLEKGRWIGPAQVVMHESKSIIWVTHMNRLLRVAKENLRPVSIREFSRHSSFVQNNSEDQLKAMAQRLERQLHERSGMFQFTDLSEPDIENLEPLEDIDRGPQPEEEPSRRESISSQMFEEQIRSPSYSPSIAEEHPRERETADLEVPEHETIPIEGNDSVESFGEAGIVVNVLIAENSNEFGEAVEDEGTLWSNSQTTADAYVFEFTMPKQQLERYIRNPKENAQLLQKAAKKSHTEVQYKNLNEEEKIRFNGAKKKEINCWLETDIVQKILRSRIHPSHILSSRWVLTWKIDPTSEDGRKPKARLVVRGYEDPGIGEICSDGRMLLLQTISSKHWDVQSFDIKTAFLRGKAEGEPLAMEPVKELREMLNLQPEEICILKGNAYGRVDAPLLFYREFRSKFEKEGFEAHPLDSCLFLLRNKQDPSRLEGILGTHVDDGLGGGTEVFERALQNIQKSLPFGQREKHQFRFTGLDIEQLPDFSIRINQGDYVSKIDPIDVPKTRRKEGGQKADNNEMHQLRALCGSLQYAAVHSRPDMCAKVAFLQKRICSATVEDLLEGNRILKEAKEHAQTSIMIRPIAIKDLTFASFGDASFASASQLKAQQGLFVMACTPSLGKNETSDVSPIAWNSKQIGRVVRSTLSAEAYAMSSSLDKLTWIRCMWGYILDPKFQWQKPEVALQTVHKALLITDCKSLFDLVTKLATPNCQEWRTTIEVMLIKEQSQGHSICRWISTAIMLADALTKPMDASFIRKVLSLGRFRIYDETHTLKENANKKFGSRWINSCEKEK